MKLEQPCKKCRRQGKILFLKGERCFSPKCPFLRRSYAPGMHGPNRRRMRVSEFAEQLAEKQNLRLAYGLSEKQLANYFAKVSQQKKETKDALLEIIERRLDNLVFRAGLAMSRRQARQLVNHGFFKVNGRPTDIASCLLKIGDKVSFKGNKAKAKILSEIKKRIKDYQAPAYLILDKKELSFSVKAMPKVEEIELPANISKVIEFYTH